MTRRITLEVAEAVRERLDRLKERSEAASVTEVIRRALAVYELLLDEDVNGGRVMLHAADGTVRQLVVR